MLIQSRVQIQRMITTATQWSEWLKIKLKWIKEKLTVNTCRFYLRAKYQFKSSWIMISINQWTHELLLMRICPNLKSAFSDGVCRSAACTKQLGNAGMSLGEPHLGQGRAPTPLHSTTELKLWGLSASAKLTQLHTYTSINKTAVSSKLWFLRDRCLHPVSSVRNARMSRFKFHSVS